MAIDEKLIALNTAKQDIKTAIETKGIPMTNVAFGGYAEKIDEIQTGVDVYSMLISEGLDYYKIISKGLYIAYNKDNLFESAWTHSLAVDPEEISASSSSSGGGGGGGGAPSGPRGTAQYPNGEIDGVIIPYGVTSIGMKSFDNWSSNNQPLVIPDSVTSIGVSAFKYWLSNNQPLVIPNSVTSIGDSAFSNWSSNNQPLVIPNSMASIGNSAFKNWSLVPYIEMKSVTPPTLVNANAFDGQNNPIYVPDESVDAYKTATNWVSLASRILAVSKKP